jgi:hypothetical protein
LYRRVGNHDESSDVFVLDREVIGLKTYLLEMKQEMISAEKDAHLAMHLEDTVMQCNLESIARIFALDSL